MLAIGAAGEHVGRDGLAFAACTEQRAGQDVTLPEDLSKS
jgi:hypothetical protein